VAQVEQRQSGTRFEIDILASASVPDCPPDLVGLPFRMVIPLNMTSLPAGTYSVAVNGVETSFEWSNASDSALPASENLTGDLRPLTVEDLVVEVGRGSPLPVEVVASGTWPDLCAQLAEVSQQHSADRIEISLSASPADPACPPDPAGIPFRVAVPLNMVEIPFGDYTVVVNGVETTFEWIGATSEPMPIENLGLTVAYIGADGNLWVADASGGPPRQITSDAASMEAGGDVVSYYFPKISFDGRYIAARRDAGVPIAEGVQYQFGLWVYDTETGESQPVYEDADSPPGGFDWKPGTHLLAYGVGSDPNYFTIRDGKPDATLATGINAFDLDTGESSLLVSPEKGYTLILPTWSPDGRYLSFDELIYMEGRGPFAYYDFDAQQYIAWDEPLGNYDWSPDGSQIVYDRLSYTATGTERIFTRPRLEGAEAQISPDPDLGYAFYPVYSPDGLQIAYLTNLGGPESVQHTLVVHDLSTGETRELGSYEWVWYLEWSSDGKALVFNAGPQESQQVYGYDLVHESATVLAEGSQPSLARP
jgi:Tol biopolymer transport system component